MTDQQISLHQLEIISLDLPQKSVFKSGIGTRKSKETLIVKWIDTEGRVGYGECSCRPDPYYSAEFLESAVILIQKFIAPKLRKNQTYGDLLAILKQVRGWNFTKAAVESAAYKVIKQSADNFFLSRRITSPTTSHVPVGISLGIYPDAVQMYDVVQQAIEEGYQRLKFKISPLMDTTVFEKVNPLLFDNHSTVSFDANGSYQSANLDKLRYFVETYDAYIEQPTPPDRFDTLLQAKQLYPNMKVCFDEEVKSIGDLIKLNSLQVIDELNLKIGRVGGITNSIEVMNFCYENDIPCWIGGMFETGVGRQQNLELAAFLPNATAHDLSPSSRYFKEDIIDPEIKMDKGFIHVNNAMMSTLNQEKMKKYITQKITIKI